MGTDHLHSSEYHEYTETNTRAHKDQELAEQYQVRERTGHQYPGGYDPPETPYFQNYSKFLQS